MQRRTDLVLLAARSIVGLIFVSHAIWKFAHPGATPFPPAILVGLGVVELLAGSLLILGLFTRAAAVPLTGVMVGALAIVQLQAPGTHPFGLHAELERDLLILVGLAGILAAGAGRYALEARFPQLRLVPRVRDRFA